MSGEALHNRILVTHLADHEGGKAETLPQLLEPLHVSLDGVDEDVRRGHQLIGGDR